MKKLFTLLALAITLITTAQAPQGFNYQAIVRNSSGQLLLNQDVRVKFNILQNSSKGDIVYSETQTANTDDLGQINLVVGRGTAPTGTFSAINWGGGSYFLGIELDSGSGYVPMGTTQLLSVPYALYSGSSHNKGKTSIMIIGNITNSQAATKISNEAGSYTENIIIENTTTLTSVDLSNITDLMTIDVTNNLALSSINLSSLNFVYWDIRLSGNAFPSSQINTLLHNFLRLSTAGRVKYIHLGGQTPPAPPTGQGIIDKAALISLGWNVFTD
jgi:hypothetical protein